MMRVLLTQSIGMIAFLFLVGCTQDAQQIFEDLASIRSPQSVPSPKSVATTQSNNTSQMEGYVVDRINEIRQQEGLGTLQLDDQLADVARAYSQRMANEDFFSHTSPIGDTPDQRVKAAGISYWVMGENLFTSTNAPQPQQLAVEGWMESPGHRENIMQADFNTTGVGVWQDGNTFYFTQLFVGR